MTCLRLLQALRTQEDGELRLQRLRDESLLLQNFLQKLESAEAAADSEAAAASEVSRFISVSPRLIGQLRICNG